MAKINDKVLTAKKRMISQYKNRNKMTRIKNRENIREIWNELDDNEKDILRRELKRGTEGLEITVKFVATIITMVLGAITLVFNFIKWTVEASSNVQKGDVFVIGALLLIIILFIGLYYFSGFISMKMKMESEYLLDMIGEE